MTENVNGKMEIELNHNQFTLLGLVAEGEPEYQYQATYPYMIHKKIKERGMEAWTNIGEMGRSSIYRILKEIESLKLITHYTEEVDNRRRKVYSITERGIRVLKKRIFEVLHNFMGKNDEEFYVAFSMLPLLDQEQQVEALNNSIKIIKKHIEELERMLKQNIQLPLNVTGLFIHPIEILKTDIKFLKWVLEEIKKGKGKVSLNNYVGKQFESE